MAGSICISLAPDWNLQQKNYSGSGIQVRNPATLAAEEIEVAALVGLQNVILEEARVPTNGLGTM